MKRSYIEERHHSFSQKKKIKSDKERKLARKRLYLGEIIDKEKPEFGTNNLILAPVGSGKSHLIENSLIPKDFTGDVLYLVSTTSLKDAVAPSSSKKRAKRVEEGKSLGFYTSSNKERFGDVDYGVHVMTYHEFGGKILSPQETFTEKFDIIFCDEIHSVEIYARYDGGGRELHTASRWLFEKHEGKIIYYFTATKQALEKTSSEIPGYLDGVNIYNYLSYPNIVKYEARSKYFISNSYQLKNHLDAKIDYVNSRGRKGLAFTRRISSQVNIEKIANESGYKPITLWSINNQDNKMSKEQLYVRDYILETGNIPDPYNLIIINSAMVEGWSLTDDYVDFAILDTLDETEQIQALGRIRKDIDFLILKVKGDDVRLNSIEIDKNYLDIYLTPEDKETLSKELNVINNRGIRVKWPTIKNLAKDSGYVVKDEIKTIDGKRRGVSVITDKRDLKANWNS